MAATQAELDAAVNEAKAALAAAQIAKTGAEKSLVAADAANRRANKLQAEAQKYADDAKVFMDDAAKAAADSSAVKDQIDTALTTMGMKSAGLTPATKGFSATQIDSLLQMYQVEPPIVAQVINAGMRRVQQDPQVQEAVQFLQGALGQRLTFTMADVEPLARFIRQRVGLATSKREKSNKARNHASTYGRLLGETLKMKTLAQSLVQAMRAYSQLRKDAKSGPVTRVSREAAEIAMEEFGIITSGTGKQMAGDSKDLYALITGTLKDFDEGSMNIIDDADVIGVSLEVVTKEDGKADFEKSMLAMYDIARAAGTNGIKDNEIVDPRKARRLGKTFKFVSQNGAIVLDSLTLLQNEFAKHGRVFVAVE
jgi:hypothetical protein